MSLRLRLIALVCVVLLASLAFGVVGACLNASRSVRTEMRAALLVGRQTIETGIERLKDAPDPRRDLDALIASFEGNRHLRVRLVGKLPVIAAPAVERAPFGKEPSWFVRMIGVAPVTERIPIVVVGHDYGIVAIQSDPQNEILEVWNEFSGSVMTQAMFYGLTILSIYLFIGRALRPLDGLATALEEIGDGRYRTRISGKLPPELSRLRDSFNRMSAQLAASDRENRRLNEQLVSLQEAERSDLARDLHDEVGPYLFAIHVDAAMATRLLGDGSGAEAQSRLQAITEAVRHLQRQVRGMLSRLRPIGLAEFGLPEAIGNIVGFWQRRRPDIRYRIAVSAECEGLGDPVGSTICRIVQESLSNAMRHAAPTAISVSITHDRDSGEVRIEVADNGSGMPEPGKIGYGLLGLGERVAAMGGRLIYANKAAGEGFAVVAAFPWARDSDAAAGRAQVVES